MCLGCRSLAASVGLDKLPVSRFIENSETIELFLVAVPQECGLLSIIFHLPMFVKVRSKRIWDKHASGEQVEVVS